MTQAGQRRGPTSSYSYRGTEKLFYENGNSVRAKTIMPDFLRLIRIKLRGPETALRTDVARALHSRLRLNDLFKGISVKKPFSYSQIVAFFEELSALEQGQLEEFLNGLPYHVAQGLHLIAIIRRDLQKKGFLEPDNLQESVGQILFF